MSKFSENYNFLILKHLCTGHNNSKYIGRGKTWVVAIEVQLQVDDIFLLLEKKYIISIL